MRLIDADEMLAEAETRRDEKTILLLSQQPTVNIKEVVVEENGFMVTKSVAGAVVEKLYKCCGCGVVQVNYKMECKVCGCRTFPYVKADITSRKGGKNGRN